MLGIFFFPAFSARPGAKPQKKGSLRIPKGLKAPGKRGAAEKASEFAKAVDRVATVSSERSRAVKLSLDEDRLVLSVNAPDSGAAEEELATG